MSFSFSAVLDVAIGLFFVFLLTSLICSQINDRIQAALRMRAKGLEDGLRRFITSDFTVKDQAGNDQKLRDLIYANPLIKAVEREDGWMTQWLDNNPRLRGLLRSKEKVLGIPNKTFALTLFNILVPNPENGETTVHALKNAVETWNTDLPIRAPLLSILSTANNKIDTARENLEQWYDLTMKKTTELYQAHMWRMALAIGLALSILLNVDTVSIGVSLWNDQTLRSALVAEAGSYAQATPEKQAALDKLNALNLPIGWTAILRPKPCLFPTDWFTKPQPGKQNPVPLSDPCSPPAVPTRDYVLKLFGWLVTALAGAQGAPFWFDLLRKLTSR